MSKLLAIILALCAPSLAATHWVSSNGTVTYTTCVGAPLSGTSACSLTTANASAVAGDLVYLRAGTYVDQQISPANNGNNSGLPGSYITYSAYTGETVTFQAASNNSILLSGNSYIKITGIVFTNGSSGNIRLMEVMNGSNHNEIGPNNTFNSTSGYAIDMKIHYGGCSGNRCPSPATHNWFHDNLVESTATQAQGGTGGPGCTDGGGDALGIGDSYGTFNVTPEDDNNNTIENNTFSHANHALVESFGRFGVLRNNVFHNEPWSTAGSACLASAANPASYTNTAYNGKYSHRNLSIDDDFNRTSGIQMLIENNRFGHAGVNDSNDGADGLTMGGTVSVLRYNFFYNNMGPGMIFKWGWNSPYNVLGNGRGGSYNRVYSNTFYHNGAGYPTGFTCTLSTCPWAQNNVEMYSDSDIGDTMRNNLLYQSSGWTHWGDDVSSKNGGTGFGTWGTIADGSSNYCTGVQTDGSVTGSGSTGCKNTSGSDPKFTNPDLTQPFSTTLPDLTLQSGSPAIDGGGPLTTTTNSGTGSTALTVTDAQYFQDGTWGSDLSRPTAGLGGTMQGDCIAIGTVTNVACISAITYGTFSAPAGTITLKTAATWSNGANVWLYSKSDGTRVLYGSAPDYGAAEFSGTIANTPTCSTNCAGSYSVPVIVVTLANSNSGTTVMCVTINGTTPVTNGSGTGCTTGTPLSGASATYNVSFPETLKVVAGSSTTTDSSVLSEAYTMTQPWAGIIDGTRAIDWTAVGIAGGVPSSSWTKCGSTLAPSGGDDTSAIQTALNGCTPNQYVLLSSGTFTTNGTFNIPAKTALRGQGANSTIINVNSTLLTVNLFGITLGYANGASGSTPNFARTTAVTSANTKGDTSITVTSASGMAMGDLAWIADLNAFDSSCGVIGSSGTTTNLTPDTPCVTTAPVVAGNFGPGGASSFDMDAAAAGFGQRAAGQMNQITNISGTTLTLKDQLHDSFRHALPDWQPGFTYFQGTAINPSAQPTHVYYMTTATSNGSGPIPCTSGGSAPTFPTNGTTVTDGSSSPQCVWQDAGAGTDSSPRLMYFVPAVNAGLENLQIFGVNNLQWGNLQSLIYFNTCSACWVTGVEINRPIGFIMRATYSYDGVIESNYFTSSWNHGSGSDSVINLDTATSGFLVDNNIFERTPETAFTDSGASGNVIAYNYGVGQWGANSLNALTNSILSHQAFPRFNLIEGNIIQGIGKDPIHGGNGFDTFFRNWILGTNLICNPVSALGLNTGGTLIRPANPAVSTNAVGGATTYTYTVEAVVGGAQSPPGTGTSIGNGPATLSGSVFNTITAPLISGTQQCLVYRTAGAASGLIGSIACDGSSTLNDTGQAVEGLGILGAGSTFVATGTVTCSPTGSFGGAGINGWLSQAANWLTALGAVSTSFNSVGNIHGSTNLNTLATQISTTEIRQACSICDNSCVAGGGGGSTIKCGLGSRVFSPSIIDETFGYTTSPPATPYDSTLAQDTMFRCKNYYHSTNTVETGACASNPTLSTSFYLGSRPSWWTASLAFPAIGSDITGGSAASFSFAKTIPAQNCFTNIMGGQDGGAGSPLSFNATTCYSNFNPAPSGPMFASNHKEK